MTSKIWFYNHFGELEDGGYPITTTPRSWVLNGYGRTDFAISYADTTLLREKLLQTGNFVRIVHYPNEEEGRTVFGTMPEWVGMIIPAKQWNKDALVVSAVSIEALLAYRAMPLAVVQGTPDAVFRQIIQYATTTPIVKDNSISLTIGRVDTSVPDGTSTAEGETNELGSYTDSLTTNAYDHIQKLVKAAGMDWDVTATVIPGSGALQLHANLYNLKGREGLVLTPQNSDDQNPLLTEQGTITNHVYGYSQAQTAATRIMREIKRLISIAKYGPFETNMVFTGVTTSAGMIGALAQARLNLVSNPVKIVSRTALDYLDTFSFVAAGNICFVYDPRVGFNPDGSLGFRSWARLLSIDYNDLTNKAGLNIQLITRDVAFPDPESFFQ